MVANQKVTGTALTMPAGLGLGLLISAVLTVTGSMLLAWMVGCETISEASMGYGIIGILLLSSALGAEMAVLRIKRQRLIVSLLSGVCYFLLLLAATALFFGGQYSGIWVTALVILAGSGTIGLLGLKGQGKRRGTHRRKKYSR